MWFRRKRKTVTLPPPPETPRAPQGRRFLDNAYLLPKDMQEIGRLDFQHYLLRHALGGNYLAPIENPVYILDVGTGTGRWAKEMAMAFPGSRVMGLDLEQAPGTGPIPPNYSFVSGNVLQRLPIADHTFHYVHQRLLVAAIPKACWPAVIRELVRVAKPGGWIELTETGSFMVDSGPGMDRIFEWGLEVALERGIDGRMIPFLGDYLRDAGLYHVKTGHVDIPLGSWGGRLGTMMQEDMLSGLAGMEPLFATKGYVSDFRELLALLPEEWEHHHTKYRCYYRSEERRVGKDCI